MPQNIMCLLQILLNCSFHTSGHAELYLLSVRWTYTGWITH